jgi:hypothetical protein
MPSVKNTTAGIRFILYLASFLVLSVSTSLFFFPEKTDIYFSWTINPPLTAAFLGAGYLASFFLEFLSAREKIWARTRPAVPGVWLFTLLTLIVTLIHIDRFHFGSTVPITLVGTWVWLIIYITVPIALGIFWFRQVRQPGTDPERKNPLPGWMRLNLSVQGLVMLVTGIALLLFSEQMFPVWPWKLSALTARAIGAWGAGIGVLALQAAWENDWPRLRSFMMSYAIYGTLLGINLLRFTSTFDWSNISAPIFAVFVGAIFVTGAYGTIVIQRTSH